MRLRRATIILLVVLACAGGPPALGQTPHPTAGGSPSQLVADLSQDLIAITAGFTGTEVLLFGATEGEGEIIVVVRSPESRVIVRRKERVGGVWLNAESLAFEHVPGFYYVGASQPISALLSETVLKEEQIGAQNLRFKFPASTSKEQLAEFRQALIRNKNRAGLFNAQLGQVKFLGNRLFRTQVRLPSSVPTGVYTVTVFLVVDGAIVDRTVTPLQVRKSGFEATVFEFANQNAPLYGAIAVLIALAAGWFAGIVFRNV